MRSHGMHIAVAIVFRRSISARAQTADVVGPDGLLALLTATGAFLLRRFRDDRPRPSTTVTRLVCLILFLAAGTVLGSAQITTVTAEQAPPIPGAGHDYIKLMNETVVPATGAVDLHIDAAVPPDRGVTVPFAIGYDSNSGRHFNDGTPIAYDNGGYLSQGGWRYIVPELQYTLTVQQVIQPGGTIPTNCDIVDHYILTDLEGTLHPLGLNSSPNTWQGCTGTPQAQSWPNGSISQNGDGLVTATTTPLNATPAASPQAPAVTVFNQDGMLYSFSNSFGRTHGPGKYWVLTAGGNNIPESVNAVTSMPDFIEDRNGNQVVYSDDDKNLDSSGAFHITDTLGRTAVSASSFGNPNGDTVSISGLSQPFTLTWGTATFNWNYKAHVVAPPLSTGWFCAVPSGSTNSHIGGPSATTADAQGTASGSGPVVTAFGLPNGLSYQFLYDNPNGDNPFGLLRKVIYPNGAYVRYVWELNTASTPVMYNAFSGPGATTSQPLGLACEAILDSPSVAKRFVSFDGVHEVQEQDFSYSTTWSFTNNNVGAAYQTWTQKQTTVVTKDLVTNASYNTVYSYIPVFDSALGNDSFGAIGQTTGVYQVHPGERTILYEDGSGNVLRMVTNGGVMNEFVPPQNVLTTLDNGLSSLTRTDYRGSAIADQYHYDFGNTLNDSASTANPFPLGPHGPLLQHIHADYNHVFPLNPLMPAVNNATPISTAISDRPSDLITYDGNGNRTTEIDYCYDGDTSSFTGCASSSLASASATGHDDKNFSTSFMSGRGNATTRIVRCFSGASQTGCSQGDSITGYAYDQTGQQVSKKDPNGNTTLYNFSDSFFEPIPPSNASTPPGSTNAYLTKITYPSINGVSHIESFSYAYSDGALTVLTDENGNQTKYTYNDTLRRLTKTDLPDGGETTVTYNDSGSSPNVVANKKIDSSHTLTTTVVGDGMGHPIQTQANSDPAGVDYTDTAYDGLGRVISASNPHRSTSASTDGVTKTQYDPLGRATQVTRQDGSVSSVSYVANCSIALDEAGRRRRSCSDALGRLTEVDEPTPGVSETIQATNATATVTLSGSLESKPSSNPATGTLTISGTDSIVPGTNAYDFGTVTVTVGNASVSVSYGNNGSSPSAAGDVATALCGQITSTPSTNTQVSCGTSGNVINVAAKAPGTAGNGIALAVGARTQVPQSNQSAFASSFTSGSLSGGGTPIYDSGTASIAISGRGYKVSWSGSATTAAGIASSLASAISNDPTGFVSASVSGDTISLTARDIGISGNSISLACSSGYDANDFTSPSFSIACPSGLSGGHEAGSLSAPMVTLYTYDGLGNLLQVSQQGGTTDQTHWRIRAFTYDSLSRLLTATNPESGKISYAYDPNGNMVQRISPAPNQASTATQAISYCYDALNRITDKSYTAQPPVYRQPCTLTGVVVHDSYDSGTNAIGHLTSLTDQAGAGSYTYDVMGRIASEQRTISGVTKGMGYTYNLDGSTATQTYPSGAIITYTPDSAGRVGMVQDLGNNINYVVGPAGPGTSASYGPDGALSGFLSGATGSFAGINNAFSFNNRLQPINMIAVSPSPTPVDATASVTISGSLNASPTGGGNPPLAASGSPLTSFVASDGSSHAFYLSTNQHVWHLFWNSTASWQNQDLTAITGNTTAAASSKLSSVFDSSGNTHVFYLDANQHVHELFCCSWQDHDLTAITGSPTAISGSAMASTGAAQGNTVHLYYQGGNQHLYHMSLSNSGNWSSQDVTAVTGTWSCSCSVVNAPATGSALTSVADSSGASRVYFLSGNQHINETETSGNGWYNTDMTAFLNISSAAAGSALSSTGSAQGATVNVYYQGANQHLYRMFLGWQNQDVTASAGSVSPASGSSLTSMVDNNGLIRTYFLDGNQHVHETWCCNGSGGSFDTDMTTYLNTNAAAGGSALTSFGVAAGNPVHVHYMGTNQHLYHMYLSGSGVWGNQDLFPLAAVTLPDSGTVSLNVGGFMATACFGPSSNSACAGQDNTTASTVASALAQAMNVSNSPATATVNATTLNLTWKTGGNVTSAVSALATTHDQPGEFPNPSFTSPATSFSGGGSNVTVFSLTYDFHAGNGDTGNVWGITNNRDATRSQTFTYDALNRLASAQNAGTDCTKTTVNGKTSYWGDNYGYDAWGNLLQKVVTRCSAEGLILNSDAQNRLHAISGPDYQYDAAGNMTHDATTGNNYSYDPENRITGAAGFTYTYDTDGNRVEKSNGSTGTIYWYMAPGIVAESDLTGALTAEYVFFDGERVARKDFPANAVSYYFSDHLKTASVITNAAGTITEDEDYYPWGGELQFVNSDSNHYKFTGKERDAESGLDYFGARYYANWTGRFLSADWAEKPEAVPYASLGDPQSLNLYSYVRNIPTSDFDPDGHADCTTDQKTGVVHCQVWKKLPPGNPATPPQGQRVAQRPMLPFQTGVPCEMDCNRAIVNNALHALNSVTSIGGLLNTVGNMGNQQPTNTIIPLISVDLAKLGKLLNILSVIDSTGKAPSGHKGGQPFQNREGHLPAKDGSGNTITYQEWDVKPYTPGVNRGSERLVTGSDGSAYYTNTHYGDNGPPAFQRIR